MKRKMISMLMSLCVMLVMLPQLVHAAETNTEPTYATQVNPLFEGTVTEADLLPLGEAAEGSEYTIEWEAVVDTLRKAMVDRRETVTLHYQTIDPVSDRDEFMVTLMDAALEHTGVGNEGDYLAHQYAGWTGSISAHADDTRTYLDITYTITYFTTAEQEQFVTEQLESIYDMLVFSVPWSSNYESTRAIYDYLCQNITPAQDDSDLNGTAYGALANQSANSRGYSLLLYRMLLDNNYNNSFNIRLVSGTLDGSGHVWNIVKIFDRYSNTYDVYLNADASMDAGKSQYAHFLLSDNSFPGYLRDEAYDTESFHAAHPMHTEDFLLTGVYYSNHRWTLDEAGNLKLFRDENAGNKDSRLDLHKDRVVTLTADDSVGINYYSGYCILPELNGYANLEKITLPDTVEVFANHQFSDLPALKEINIPAALTEISSSAFARCVSLETITLPATLEEFGACPFNGCTSLTGIWVDEENPYFTSDEKGVLYNKDKTVLVEAPGALQGDYVIPDSVTAIEWGAFLGCENLTGIELPNTIESIDMQTFQDCTSLTEVQIPASVTSIEFEAFSGCTSLETIKFLGCAPYIWSDVFKNVEATAYYPAGNSTWTEDKFQDYYGKLTWVPYEHTHDFETVTTQADCIHSGGTTYTCTTCWDSYTENFVAATGQHTYEDDADTECNVCGNIRDLDMPTTPMYRLYNPNSGEHFYTGSLEEREMLITAGWKYEGIAWNAPTQSGEHVYRLFNPNNGDHHYTMSIVERENLVAVGWQYEGVCWNSATTSDLPQYRLYNPNADCGSHHYTGSEKERDRLVNAGWIYEGIGWYGLIR